MKQRDDPVLEDVLQTVRRMDRPGLEKLRIFLSGLEAGKSGAPPGERSSAKETMPP